MVQNETKNIKKRKRGIETAQRIKDVASELFAHRGFDGVSVREIAVTAGIKESSLYNHFSSKANILEALYDDFIIMTPNSRPSEEEIDQMLGIMQPSEIFKNIVFHVGSHVNDTLANTAMIINYEKFKTPRAAEMYYKYVVNEPAAYYECLITKMMLRDMIKQVDARVIAEQYNYVSIALTKEYFMAKYGLADLKAVIDYVVKTLNFFCDMMKK